MLAFLLAACQLDEDCFDGRDNDGDGLIDCSDAECRHLGCDEDCFDGVDNDDDGRVDCEDGECYARNGCSEDCSDGDDNDLDGLSDCADEDCWGTGGCEHVFTELIGGTGIKVTSRRQSGEARRRYTADGTETSWRNPYVSAGHRLTFFASGVIRAGSASTVLCRWDASARYRMHFSDMFGPYESRGWERGEITTTGGCAGLPVPEMLPQMSYDRYAHSGIRSPFGAPLPSWYTIRQSSLISSQSGSAFGTWSSEQLASSTLRRGYLRTWDRQTYAFTFGSGGQALTRTVRTSTPPAAPVRPTGGCSAHGAPSGWGLLVALGLCIPRKRDGLGMPQRSAQTP